MTHPVQQYCDEPECKEMACYNFSEWRAGRGLWACPKHRESVRARFDRERQARIEQANRIQGPAQGRLW